MHGFVHTKEISSRPIQNTIAVVISPLELGLEINEMSTQHMLPKAFTKCLLVARSNFKSSFYLVLHSTIESTATEKTGLNVSHQIGQPWGPKTSVT